MAVTQCVSTTSQMVGVLCKVCCTEDGLFLFGADGSTYDSSTGSLAGKFENSCYAFSEHRTSHQKSGYFIPVVLVKKQGMQPPESINENGCTLDHLGFVST